MHVVPVDGAGSGAENLAVLVPDNFGGRMPYQVDSHVVDLDAANVHKDVVKEGQYAFGSGVALFFLLGENLRKVEVALRVGFQIEQGVSQFKVADRDAAGDGFEQFDIERQLAEICDSVLGIISQQRVFDDDPVEKGVIDIADLDAAVEAV